MTRMSTLTDSRPPTRVSSRSCSTRSSRACASSDMSPISSRNSVPPSAVSMRPLRRAWAPVKAPRSKPNSSRLEQRGGQGGAVDGDEGPVEPRRGGVDGAGDQLLARAGLAAHQHRGVRGGHPGQHARPRPRSPEPAPMSSRPASVAGPSAGADSSTSTRRRPAFQRRLHRGDEPLVVEWLDEEVRRARVQRLHRPLHGAERRHHDDGHAQPLRAQPLQQHQPVAIPQLHVEQQQVRRAPGEVDLRRRHRLQRHHRETPRAQHVQVQLAQVALVLDEQPPRAAAYLVRHRGSSRSARRLRTGSSTRATAPGPSARGQEAQPAARRLQRRARDGQPQPRPARLRRVEGPEQPLAIHPVQPLRPDRAPRSTTRPSSTPGQHLDAPAARAAHGLGGVLQQVEQHPAQLVLVAHHPQRRIQPRHERGEVRLSLGHRHRLQHNRARRPAGFRSARRAAPAPG